LQPIWRRTTATGWFALGHLLHQGRGMESGRNLIALASIALFVATGVDARGPLTTQVQEADARFRKAMTNGDVEALREIVADDAKIVHGKHGGIQGKIGLIRDFRSYQIEKYDRTPVYSLVSGNTYQLWIPVFPSAAGTASATLTITSTVEGVQTFSTPTVTLAKDANTGQWSGNGR